ncbi:hypothetical protein S40288_08458 [Stachybotrys chartarum IBT 40288]|nr:hypothetical protein S40288_08458 [Stachybotrys chartarum IBT 40288]
MDYSTSINDAEDPVGASPWGNSPAASPHHARTGFGTASDSPAPPFAYTPEPSNGLAQSTDPDAFRSPTAPTITPPNEENIEPTNAANDNSGFQSTNAEPLQQQTQPTTQPQQQHAGTEAQPGQTQRHSKPPQPQYKLQVKITGLERTGKKDPILRFDVHTNLPRFRTTQYRDVRRLHSEFVKLAEHLISANPDSLVPAVPPPITSAGAGTDEDEVRVKALMQRWFNYVCSSETLIRDDEMVLFVESDFGYSPLVKMKQPATGVRRKILKQFAPPPDETPELADARPVVKLFYLGAMDAGLGLSESDYGVKLGNMHVQEPHPGLANAYKKLGKVVQAVGDYHAAQATAEATTIGDPFQYHSQDAFIVKETLTNRQILLREFLQAQDTTRSKLNAADRLKASSSVRRDKVDEAIASLDEARQNETNLYQKTTRVTQNLTLERRKWFARTAADLRVSIREFVLREIEAERRTLALLESVRPDIRSIDASGGLSRLGREAHPTQRRSSLAASQGPKGDSWSGVPRRSDATMRSSSSTIISKVPEERESIEAEEPSTGRLGSSGQRGSVKDEDDDDRVDARNAASRLATSTF